MWRERKEKRWKDINISKIVEVKSLNLDLNLLWKDLGVKLGEIIEDYKTLLLSNFQKKRICFAKVMSSVALQSYCDRSLFWKNIKTNFWSGANTTWENLKEEVWKLGSANTLSRPSYKNVVCNHVHNTIWNIIRYMYIYVKPMYSIEFHIILKTYIHM